MAKNTLKAIKASEVKGQFAFNAEYALGRGETVEVPKDVEFFEATADINGVERTFSVFACNSVVDGKVSTEKRYVSVGQLLRKDASRNNIHNIPGIENVKNGEDLAALIGGHRLTSSIEDSTYKATKFDPETHKRVQRMEADGSMTYAWDEKTYHQISLS